MNYNGRIHLRINNMQDKLTLELDESFVKKIFELNDTLPPENEEITLQMLKKQLHEVSIRFSNMQNEFEELKKKLDLANKRPASSNTGSTQTQSSSNVAKSADEKVPKVFEGYHEELDNIEDKLGKLSETHQTLYIWGKGVIDLWEIDKILRPLKEEAAQKKEELDKLDQQLNELTQEQEAKKKELSDLEEEKNKSQAIIDDLQNQKKSILIEKITHLN